MSGRSNFDDVGDFHDQFGLPNVTWAPPGPRDVPQDLYDFRIKFLKEELQEFEDGWAAQDHALMADALVDLVYVALGTAHLFGYPWEQLWDDVQAANMRKQRVADAESSKRHHYFDVVKPEGWVPPQTNSILREHGWDTPVYSGDEETP